MAEFARSERTAEGDLQLRGGQRYFIDLQTAQFNSASALPGLIEALGHGEHVGENLLFSGMGQVMAEVAPTRDVVVPREVAATVGEFWQLPGSLSLQDAQRRLYGSTFDEPMGFLDWLADEHPGLLQAGIDTAETVVETGKAIGRVGWGIGTTAIVVGLGALALMYAWNAGKD